MPRLLSLWPPWPCCHPQPLLNRCPRKARASFVNLEGREIGEATLRQTPDGVLIRLGVSEIPSGPHAMHIHEAGRCEHQGGFQSAGGHYAPCGR